MYATPYHLAPSWQLSQFVITNTVYCPHQPITSQGQDQPPWVTQHSVHIAVPNTVSWGMIECLACLDIVQGNVTHHFLEEHSPTDQVLLTWGTLSIVRWPRACPLKIHFTDSVDVFCWKVALTSYEDIPTSLRVTQNLWEQSPHCLQKICSSVWQLVVTVNLSGFRITMETQLWMGLGECFQKS